MMRLRFPYFDRCTSLHPNHFMFTGFISKPSQAGTPANPGGDNSVAELPASQPEIAAPRHHGRLDGAMVSTASRLLPLVELLDSLQPYVVNESVFRIRRRKIIAQIRLAQAQLKAEKPQRQALLHAFQTMGELVAHEIRDISRDEVKRPAREVVLATLRNAPALINAAHQARQIS